MSRVVRLESAALPSVFTLCLQLSKTHQRYEGERFKYKKVQTNAYLFLHGHTVCKLSRKIPVVLRARDFK